MSSDQFRNGQSVALLLDFAAFNAALPGTDLPGRYKKIIAAVAAGRRLRRATAYAALDSQSAAQDELLSAVRNSGYRIVTKPLKSLPDGSMRGYLGVDMAVDAVLAADTCDIVTIVTGDPDLLPALRAAQANGARLEVIGCPGQNLDSLREASDSFAVLGSIVGASGPNDGRNRSPDSSPASGRGQRRQEWPTPPPPPPESVGRRADPNRPTTSKRFRTLDGERLSGDSSDAERNPRGRNDDTPRRA